MTSDREAAKAIAIEINNTPIPSRTMNGDEFIHWGDLKCLAHAYLRDTEAIGKETAEQAEKAEAERDRLREALKWVVENSSEFDIQLKAETALKRENA